MKKKVKNKTKNNYKINKLDHLQPCMNKAFIIIH